VARAGLIAADTKRAAPIERVAVVGLLLGLAAAFLFVTSLPATCPMRVLLHVPCPSCGLTRAARLVASGDVLAATHMHPLWLIIFPYLAVTGSVQFAHYLRHGTWVRFTGAFGRVVRVGGQLIVALLIVVWIARFFGAFGGPAAV
jgi:hypothetical protein